MASRESFTLLFDIFIVIDKALLTVHIMFSYRILYIQDWRRRFFILKGSRLFFAKNPHDLPHGMIDLSRCTTVKSADLKAHKKHSFEISTPETTFLLYAGE